MLMYHELQLAADFMNKRTEATLNKCGLSDITDTKHKSSSVPGKASQRLLMQLLHAKDL